MYSIEYLESAKKDIDDAIFYIRYYLCNRTAAINLHNAIQKEIQNISLFPYGNSAFIPNIKLDEEYRSSRVKNYSIFYTIDENAKTVIIVRIQYNKRLFEKLLTFKSES